MTYVDRAAHQGPSVLIPRKGSLDRLYYTESPFWNVDTIFYTEIGDRLIPKFLYYYLQKCHLETLNEAAGVPSLTQSTLNQIAIPVPSLDEQREIVEKLDAFDFLTTSLTSGLPAEIAARKRQYEYYREQLLTFEDA